jgi:formylglycine-generating enzyme
MRRIAVVVGAFLMMGASMEDAPAPCRAQAKASLAAIEPAYAGKARKVAGGQPGSIEAAIAGYVPPKFHPEDDGSLPPVKPNATCPADMAPVLGRYCVDKYEGILVEKQPDGSEKTWSPYVVPEKDHTYFARSVKDVVPQGYVSAKTAEAACRASGKRLCQPSEWRVACAGSEGTVFPYGPARVAGKCRDNGTSPMVAYHSATMKRGWGLTELNDPRNNQMEGTLAKTGAFPDCVNDFGAYDMVGNLHEWTADTNGTFQGGYYLDTSQHGDGCAYRTISHGYEYHDYSTGFRCCADPTTASTP